MEMDLFLELDYPFLDISASEDVSVTCHFDPIRQTAVLNGSPPF